MSMLISNQNPRVGPSIFFSDLPSTLAGKVQNPTDQSLFVACQDVLQIPKTGWSLIHTVPTVQGSNKLKFSHQLKKQGKTGKKTSHGDRKKRGFLPVAPVAWQRHPTPSSAGSAAGWPFGRPGPAARPGLLPWCPWPSRPPPDSKSTDENRLGRDSDDSVCFPPKHNFPTFGGWNWWFWSRDCCCFFRLLWTSGNLFLSYKC